MVDPEIRAITALNETLKGIKFELHEIRKELNKSNSKFEGVKRYRSLDALFQEMDEDDEADMKD